MSSVAFRFALDIHEQWACHAALFYYTNIIIATDSTGARARLIFYHMLFHSSISSDTKMNKTDYIDYGVIHCTKNGKHEIKRTMSFYGS